jgi:hypothetical protein
LTIPTVSAIAFDPILNYDQISKKERQDINQDRKITYTLTGDFSEFSLLANG